MRSPLTIGVVGSEATEVTVPSNTEKHARSGVTNTLKGTNQPTQKPIGDSPLAASKVKIEQALVDKNKTISKPLTGKSPPSVSLPLPFTDSGTSSTPIVLTARQIAAFEFFGEPLPPNAVSSVAAIPQSTSNVVQAGPHSANVQSTTPAYPPAQQLGTSDNGRQHTAPAHPKPVLPHLAKPATPLTMMSGSRRGSKAADDRPVMGESGT